MLVPYWPPSMTGLSRASLGPVGGAWGLAELQVAPLLWSAVGLSGPGSTTQVPMEGGLGW